MDVATLAVSEMVGEHLRPKLNGAVFERWFSGLRVSLNDDESLKLSVSPAVTRSVREQFNSEQLRTWIVGAYSDVVEEALGECGFGPEFEIEVRTGGSK